jgi:hypothetical protein
MPFSNLNNSWSNLAQYYNSVTSNGVFAGTISNPNVTKTQKPEYPKIQYSSFDDGLIRSGLVNTGISVLRDTARIGKFFTSGKGVLFVAKQVGLQLSNPKLESKKTPPTTPGNAVAGVINSVTNALGPTRTYNLGLNTLASVGGTAFGLHFDRAGILPIINDNQKYGGNIYNLTAGVAWYNNFSDDTKNSNLKINKDSSNRLLQYADVIFRGGGGSIDLTSYFGGAQSVYGIYPKTIIRTTTERSSDAINRFTNSETYNNDGFNPLTNREIAGLQRAKLTSNLESQLNANSEILTYNSTIAGYNIEKRVGTTGTFKKVDAINVIDIVDGGTFYTNTNSTGSLASKVLERDDVDGIYGNDIIKFRLEFLNNDGTPGVDNTTVLAFRAYIDDFNDGMNAKWNSYRYMGRGEEFYVYEGFTRDINVSFTLFAHSVAEMKPLYRKLNYLMSTFAPDYSPANKMRGNIGYLTVGEYLLRQPGVFTDIKLSGFLDTHWEIGIDGNDQYEVPKHIKVGLSFKPIHTFLPRKAKYTNGKPDYNTPFITPDSKRYTYFANDKKENKYLG